MFISNGHPLALYPLASPLNVRSLRELPCQAPTTQFTAAAFVAASDDGNSFLVLKRKTGTVSIQWLEESWNIWSHGDFHPVFLEYFFMFFGELHVFRPHEKFMISISTTIINYPRRWVFDSCNLQTSRRVHSSLIFSMNQSHKRKDLVILFDLGGLVLDVDMGGNKSKAFTIWLCNIVMENPL